MKRYKALNIRNIGKYLLIESFHRVPTKKTLFDSFLAEAFDDFFLAHYELLRCEFYGDLIIIYLARSYGFVGARCLCAM
jgi:hypothetical protein